jgi:O-antigen ligase
LVISLLIVLIISQPFITRLRGGQRLEIKSVQQRLNQFDQAQQLILENWLIGIGIGNYTLAVYQEIDSQLPVWDYQPVHNIFLLVLAELGIAGVVVFVFLCFCVFVKTWQQKNYFGLSILLALAVISFFDHYLWTLYFGVMLFWLGLGLSLKSQLFSN